MTLLIYVHRALEAHNLFGHRVGTPLAGGSTACVVVVKLPGWRWEIAKDASC